MASLARVETRTCKNPHMVVQEVVGGLPGKSAKLGAPACGEWAKSSEYRHMALVASVSLCHATGRSDVLTTEPDPPDKSTPGVIRGRKTRGLDCNRTPAVREIARCRRWRNAAGNRGFPYRVWEQNHAIHTSVRTRNVRARNSGPRHPSCFPHWSIRAPGIDAGRRRLPGRRSRRHGTR